MIHTFPLCFFLRLNWIYIHIFMQVSNAAFGYLIEKKLFSNHWDNTNIVYYKRNGINYIVKKLLLHGHASFNPDKIDVMYIHNRGLASFWVYIYSQQRESLIITKMVIYEHRICWNVVASFNCFMSKVKEQWSVNQFANPLNNTNKLRKRKRKNSNLIFLIRS